ncbi:CACNA1A [Bugula neritina]|uniref:CACNA1A n=1 Tax=Bugula neritina TaxID=10212 RepID=A0A7J7KP86_BUGNE|nr:CACNA1A [Bugula neritina]
MAIYYVIFFIIFPFFFVNIFVALIIITFQQQGDTELEDQNLDKNQKQCIDFVVNAKRMDKYVPRNKLGNQHRIWVIVNSWPFDFFIMLIIALNTIVLMTKYHKEDEDLTPLDHLFKEKILNYVNIVFTSVFTIECALKIYAFNPKNYFRDAWNAFDFITVVGSIVDIFVSNYSVSMLLFSKTLLVVLILMHCLHVLDTILD